MSSNKLKTKRRKVVSTAQSVSPGFVTKDDMLSQVVWHFFDNLNLEVSHNLKNKADLTSLLPMTMVIAGLFEFFRRPQPPKWNEWMWYGYSMFRDLNSEKKKMPHFHQEGFDRQE